MSGEVGHPPHEPTEKSIETVTMLAGLGMPQDDIARALEIDAKTLRKHYRDQLDDGVYRANSAVAKRLYKLAMDGNVAACIFWLKVRGKKQWSERLELSGPEGKDLIPPNLNFNFDNGGPGSDSSPEGS